MKDFLLKLHAQEKYCLKIKLAREHCNNEACSHRKTLGTKGFTSHAQAPENRGPSC